MTILKNVAKPRDTHACRPPQDKWGVNVEVGAGSLWRCDECGAVWIVRGKPGFVSNWWKESERQRRKRWNRGEIYKEELL
jgi:hypothetical protein